MRKLSIIIPLFIFIFLYFWFRIDPRLLYQAQEPPFLFGSQFLSTFITYPGGLAWYASAFLTQFYIYPWLGALIITLVLVLIYWQTALFMRSIGSRNSSTIFTALPVLVLFAAYTGYTFPLTYMICLLIALLFFNLYKQVASPITAIRLSLYCILAIIAYYSTGIGAVLFSALCALDELLVRKRYAAGLIIVGVIAIMPAIAARFVFVILTSTAYYDVLGLKTSLLDAAIYPRIPAILYGIFLYFPAVIAVFRLSMMMAETKKKPLSRNLFADTTRFLNGTSGFFVQAGVMTLLLICAGTLFFDSKSKENYRISYCADHRFWDKIVSAITPETITRYSIASQAQLFRALYFENRLLSDLFSYPQAMPSLSFEMVSGKMAKRFPLLLSDLNFDAGALNAAEYRAHEALSMQGKKTAILQRLALINVVKGQREKSDKFLSLLEKTLFSGRTVAAYRRLLDSDSLVVADEYLRTIRHNAPKIEYVGRDFYFELANLMHCNNKNRIVLEYLMAGNLLNNNISGIVDNLSFFSDGGYDRLPRHIQEALVFQMMASGSDSTTMGGFQLDTDLFRQLNDFTRIMSQYGADRNSALKSLYPQYGTTYWYYLASNGRKVLLKGTGENKQ